jgi:hypothetical protein
LDTGSARSVTVKMIDPDSFSPHPAQKLIIIRMGDRFMPDSLNHPIDGS